jgi:DNA-binding response OmpR family regulator
MLAEALALSLCGRGYDCRVARLDGPESVLSQAAAQRPALVLLDLDLAVASEPHTAKLVDLSASR